MAINVHPQNSKHIAGKYTHRHTHYCLPHEHDWMQQRVYASMHFFIWKARVVTHWARESWLRKQSHLIPFSSTASKRNVIKATKSPMGPATCYTTNMTRRVIRPTYKGSFFFLFFATLAGWAQTFEQTEKQTKKGGWGTETVGWAGVKLEPVVVNLYWRSKNTGIHPHE